MACSICFNHIHEKYILKCNHVFHETCILKWTQIKNECPLCRCVIHLHDNAKLTQLINHINSISGFQIHKPDDQYMYIWHIHIFINYIMINLWHIYIYICIYLYIKVFVIWYEG